MMDGEERDNNGDSAIEPPNNEDSDSEDSDEDLDKGVDELSKPAVLANIYLAKNICEYYLLLPQML